MDRARQRFADNIELLKKFNPELEIMSDRYWTDHCENSYIQHMAKKLWMHPFTEQEVEYVNKAVTGYLFRERQKAESEPVQPGGRVIKGTIMSVRKTCEHGDNEHCMKHYRMNVRDTEARNTLYTPLPYSFLAGYDPQALVGKSISFYAYVTVSTRDNTFGFAHKPKLMQLKEG